MLWWWIKLYNKNHLWQFLTIALATWIVYCSNYLWGTSPSTWNFGLKWPRCSEIADYRSIFARSASTVIPSEKRSIVRVSALWRHTPRPNVTQLFEIQHLAAFEFTEVRLTARWRYSILISLFVKRPCVLKYTLCYLIIGDSWCIRLTVQHFQMSIFCAVQRC